MKKKIIILMCIIIFFMNIDASYVQASTSGNDIVEQNIVRFTNGILEGYDRLLRYAGIIIDTGIAASRNAGQFVKDRLIALGLLNNDATDEDVQQFFDENVQQRGKSLTFTNNVNVYIKSEANEIQNEYGFYYAYSYDMLKFTSMFASGDLYNAVRTFVEANQGNIVIVRGINTATRNCSIIVVHDLDYDFVQSDASNPPKIRCSIYNNKTWAQSVFTNYSYNPTTQQFDVNGTWPASASFAYYWLSKDYLSSPNAANDACVMSYNGNRLYKVYKTLQDLKSDSVGQSPYYISDSYNEYKNTTGSYNTNTDDHSVTYNDIVNFNNQYYGDNGNYPTAETIYQYINTNQGTGTGDDNTPTPIPTPTPTTTPDNPGGGGSGGSGEGETGIFDFLSRLGTVLGNLIKNLGEMLTNLIEGIVETITSVVGAIPNIFQPLIGYVFGGLPESIQAMIILGITCMIVVGIIKAFKG